MLIDTPLKLNDIVTLKMVGGDEVVGKLIDERTDDYIEVHRPLLVAMAQQGFGLIPYVLTAGPDCKIKIARDKVVAFTKTYDQVAKSYIQQTTSLIT